MSVCIKGLRIHRFERHTYTFFLYSNWESWETLSKMKLI